MNSINQLDRVFPMAGGATVRVLMRPPRNVIRMWLGPSIELPGDPAVLRGWATRRISKNTAPPPKP
jgi:hypothetical protein